ncbi:hypothetical protein [Deinococcus ruber]|nr:hypothetical protein [Deinococcus ruber]
MTGAVALAGGHGDVGVESIAKTVQSAPPTSTSSTATLSSVTGSGTAK